VVRKRSELRTREQAGITGGHKGVGTTIELLGFYIDTEGGARAEVSGTQGVEFQLPKIRDSGRFDAPLLDGERGPEGRGWSMRGGEESFEKRVKRMFPLSWMKREKGEVEEERVKFLGLDLGRAAGTIG
jgi:hypothetical protein